MQLDASLKDPVYSLKLTELKNKKNHQVARLISLARGNGLIGNQVIKPVVPNHASSSQLSPLKSGMVYFLGL